MYVRLRQCHNPLNKIQFNSRVKSKYFEKSWGKNQHPIRRNDNREKSSAIVGKKKCNKPMEPINETKNGEKKTNCSQLNFKWTLFSLSFSIALACTNLLNSFIKAIDLIWTFTHHRRSGSQQQIQFAIPSKNDDSIHDSRRQMIVFYIRIAFIYAFNHFYIGQMGDGSTFNFLGGSKSQFDFISNCATTTIY